MLHPPPFSHARVRVRPSVTRARTVAPAPPVIAIIIPERARAHSPRPPAISGSL